MAIARNVEWLNQNALRAFPLREDALRSPVVNGAPDRAIVLPNSAIVDFVVTLADTGEGRVMLRTLVKVGTFLTLVFSDADGVTVASVAVNTASHATNQGYAFVGSGVHEDARGRIVLGDLSELMTDIPDGQWTFDITGAEMETTTVRPALRGVRSLAVDNDGAESVKLYGHVKLVAGSNIRLTVDEDTNSIRIDARDTTGFQEECECEDQEVPTPVLTVNGIGVEDLIIQGDGKCTTVTTEGNRLIISDTCSKPCCGCVEQEFITRNLELLEHTLQRVEAQITELDARHTEFETKVGVSTR